MLDAKTSREYKDLSDQNEKLASMASMDRDNLYREEVFTDLKLGSLRQLSPVKPDGSEDPSREVMFLGQTQVMSQAGPLPVSCHIEATSLADAIDMFPQAVQEAVERLIEEVKELQRQEASQILVPGVDPGGKLPGLDPSGKFPLR